MATHPPVFASNSFDCPHCRTFAHQKWYDARASHASSPPKIEQSGLIGYIGKGIVEMGGSPHTRLVRGYDISECQKCEKAALWVEGKLIYPLTSTAPLPNLDLPDDVLGDYQEAAQIFNLSPRGAAALLRLAVEKLCHGLVGPDKSLNGCIETLVSRGLDKRVQQALDTVRVIGNDAVHPGHLLVGDNQDTVLTLFELVNIVADEMITKPRQVDDMYSKLPKSARDAINQRDSKSKSL